MKASRIVAIVLAAVAPTALMLAWTGPTAAPPGNNVSAPINTSSTDQFKAGVVGANIFNVYGTNQYISFGNTTGTSGIGFRNNGGVIEYKHSAGQNANAWYEIGKARGAAIKVSLAQCSGACGSYHAINTWINVSAYNYTWNTPINTDTATFTHNGKGVITINKAGVYRIREQAMMIPTANVAWVAHACPIINGGANCGPFGAADGLHHAYYPAGWWGADVGEFIFELGAGTTVGYGYYIYNPMTYWCHDTYCWLEVTRIN